MPAAVETYNEMAAFASLRVPAWHRLGTVFDKPVTTEKMLELAHLKNWNLRFVSPAETMNDYEFVKETLFVVRDNPFEPGRKDVLGTVGGRYKIFDNESIFNFGDVLTNGRRRWETGGSINGGTTIFASLVDTDDIVLDPSGQGDTIKRYIMLTSSHDGSSTMIAKKVNTRVVCQNTLNIALGEHGDEFRIRHTQGMETKIEDAKAALGYLDAYDTEFESEAQTMIETSVTDDQFWNLVKDIFPEPETNTRGRHSKWENKTQDIMWTWNDGTGSMNNLDKNAWRAFNTLTEYNQWFRGIRSGNEDNYYAAGAGFDNVTNSTRQQMWDRVKALV